jgi:hypothetical protein
VTGRKAGFVSDQETNPQPISKAAIPNGDARTILLPTSFKRMLCSELYTDSSERGKVFIDWTIIAEAFDCGMRIEEHR